MNRYWIRATKYILYFTLLLVCMANLFSLFNTGFSFDVFFSSDRLWIMALVVVGFSALSGYTSYTNRRLTFNAESKAEDVVRVMSMCGYKRVPNLAGEATDNRAMRFEADSRVKRIILMYEDHIDVTTDPDGLSTIAGNRKEAVRAYYRMGTYIG